VLKLIINLISEIHGNVKYLDLETVIYKSSTIEIILFDIFIAGRSKNHESKDAREGKKLS